MANKKNYAASTVATAPSPATSGTTLVVKTGEGSFFPNAPFYATLAPVGQLTNMATAEQVLVTARTGDTLTITRAQGGTTAKTVATGWIVANSLFVEDLSAGVAIQPEPPTDTNMLWYDTDDDSAPAASGNADKVDNYHANATPTANTIPVLNDRAQTGEWYEELGRTVLSGAGDVISVANIPTKKHLKIIVHTVGSGVTNQDLRFNNDSSATYAWRRSINGAADSSSASVGSITFTAGDTNVTSRLEIDVLNALSSEKLINAEVALASAGAANAGARVELTGKWANTSSQINRVDLINGNTGDFAIGSEVIVLGHN